jgi:Kef-type K+ transport system membrane component KefB
MLLARLALSSRLMATTEHPAKVLNFIYWLGLLLLMFLSGAETQQVFTREERREVGGLTMVGTGIPFVLGLVLGPWLIALRSPVRRATALPSL